MLKQIIANPLQYRDQHNPPIRIKRIKEAFGDRPAANIRPNEISNWLDALTSPKGKPLAPGSRNRYKTVFSSIYVWGISREKIAVTPVKAFKSVKDFEGVIRWLDKKEEARISAVLQHDVDDCDPVKQPKLRQHHLHRIHEMTIALETGVRQGEQFRMPWDDVNLDRRTVHLLRTKYGPARDVYLIDDVIHAMRDVQKMPLRRRMRRRGEPNKAPANSGSRSEARRSGSRVFSAAPR